MKKKQLEDKIKNIDELDRVISYPPQYNDEPTFSEKVEQLIKEHLDIRLEHTNDGFEVKLLWDGNIISFDHINLE